ncbi:glucokinase [Massilia sp. RP-1-19]|uniref:Glucokinase n=1 Tax=Massilia polaris TaxID=2728846 RepID=A0A848HJS0_9BURK|nr:glucokinase [Massilia polaris]NML59513.1 glucokinase [Massilia polaris]
MHATPSVDRPSLLADIGGTNARFALETAPGRFDCVRVLPCTRYPTLQDAMRSYLADPAVAAHGMPEAAAIAVANPVNGDLVRMTNHHWQFSIEAVRQEFGLARLGVINDFKALALALPLLGPEHKRQVGGGVAASGVIGLLGAGTGLGVSGLVPSGDGWNALDSEGGHATFSPANEREIDVLRFAWKAFPHVSAERLMSGGGLELVYRALAARAGHPASRPAAEIIALALDGTCELCVETVECFCEMLGTVAANLAVTLGAMGGIYIGGGIVPRLGAAFDASGFRRRFEEKGRFAAYLSRIPTYVITADYPCFPGVAAWLRETRATTAA